MRQYGYDGWDVGAVVPYKKWVSLLLNVVFGTLSVVFDNFRFIVFALPMIAFGLANGVVFGQRRRR